MRITFQVGRISGMQAGPFRSAQAKEESPRYGSVSTRASGVVSMTVACPNKRDRDLPRPWMPHPPRLGPARGSDQLSSRGTQETQRQG